MIQASETPTTSGIILGELFTNRETLTENMKITLALMTMSNLTTVCWAHKRLAYRLLGFKKASWGKTKTLNADSAIGSVQEEFCTNAKPYWLT